jgi:hypothetical protein
VFTKVKRRVRDLGLTILKPFACDIRDFRTGEKIARAVIIPWQGKVLFIGLEGRPIVPTFLPQERQTFWKQELGFTAHPIPDFPRVREEPRESA